MAGLFPRRAPREPQPIIEKCNPSVISSQCEGRRDARQRGQMVYDFDRDGWLLRDDMAYTRTITGTGAIDRYLKVKWAGRDTTGEPYLLELCPYCSCELPSLKPPVLNDPGRRYP